MSSSHAEQFKCHCLKEQKLVLEFAVNLKYPAPQERTIICCIRLGILYILYIIYKSVYIFNRGRRWTHRQLPFYLTSLNVSKPTCTWWFPSPLLALPSPPDFVCFPHLSTAAQLTGKGNYNTQLK